MLPSGFFVLIVSLCSCTSRVKPFVVPEKHLRNNRVPSSSSVVVRRCREEMPEDDASRIDDKAQQKGGDSLAPSEASSRRSSVTILPVRDNKHLWKFLMIAAHEKELEAVRSNPALARYVQGYDPTNDVGFVAFDAATDDDDTVAKKAVGAAWVRFWPSDENHRGFGFVRPDIPELAIGVDPTGIGTGTMLLTSLIDEASKRNIKAISLSCRDSNRAALRLYDKFRFRKVPGTETTSRAPGITSFTMIKWLPHVRLAKTTPGDLSAIAGLLEKKKKDRLDAADEEPGDAVVPVGDSSSTAGEAPKESLLGGPKNAQNDGFVLLAEIDDNPVGFVECRVVHGGSSSLSKPLWIIDFYVDREWRHSGAEKKLLQEAERRSHNATKTNKSMKSIN